jgi:hypothetical protein
VSAASFRFHDDLERFFSHRRAWGGRASGVLTRDRELLKRGDVLRGC